MVQKGRPPGPRNALITLAWMYANGTGIRSTETRARELYLQAAKRGSAKGAVCCRHNASVRPVRCEQGYPCSCHSVPEGRRPGHADGAVGRWADVDGRQGCCARDDAAALQWLSLATSMADKRAEDYVKHLIKRMDPAEVQAVRERMTRAGISWLRSPARHAVCAAQRRLMLSGTGCRRSFSRVGVLPRFGQITVGEYAPQVNRKVSSNGTSSIRCRPAVSTPAASA